MDALPEWRPEVALEEFGRRLEDTQPAPLAQDRRKGRVLLAEVMTGWAPKGPYFVLVGVEAGENRCMGDRSQRRCCNRPIELNPIHRQPIEPRARAATIAIAAQSVGPRRVEGNQYDVRLFDSDRVVGADTANRQEDRQTHCA